MTATTDVKRSTVRIWLRPVRRMTHRMSRALAVGVASVVASIFRIAPARCGILLRNRLIRYLPMDYKPAKLHLVVTSEIEYTMRLHSCRKEPETVAWLHETLQPGDVLYDIGANVGAYSLIAAHHTGKQAKIYAFEPGFSTFPHLVENIRINGFGGVIVPLPIALSASTGLSVFTYSMPDPGGASHAGLNSASAPQAKNWSTYVLTYRLDDFRRTFKLQDPTHLKIDVDGGEADILAGATDLLQTPSLRWILIEVDAADRDPAHIRTILEGCGYALHGDYVHTPGAVHNMIFKASGRA